MCPTYQGLEGWLLKMQRAVDKNFDKFEMYALRNVFAVPDNLQLVRTLDGRIP